MAVHLRFLLAALLLLAVSLPAVAEPQRPPNILLILADDVGREVLGCYGGVSYQTPHLDRLAASGARFEHCYSMPVCHPTRVCLLTGRYPRSLGNPPWGTFPKAYESRTFAHLVKRAGYTTAIAGKWQLCLMGKDLNHPRRLGFDEWSLFGWHEGPRYHEPMIYQNGKLRTDTDDKYGPELYVDFLVDFMQRNRERPFLAFYSMALCHDVTDDLKRPVPYGPRGRYDSYSEMANQMDVQIGRLLKGLDRLDLRRNTLILFTTDNGTAKGSIIRAQGGKYRRETVVSRMKREHEVGVFNIPGGKGDLTDWGTRVPTLASWQGVIRPGQVWNDLVDFSDVLPTFLELSGAPLPRGMELDGHSFARRLTHDQPSSRAWAYSEGGGRYFAKTARWKLYNDGKFFDTQHDSFERQPLDVQRLPGAARDDYAKLQTAVRSLAGKTK